MQLPDEFAASMRSLLGEADFLAFSESLNAESVVSIRPNVAKGAMVADECEHVAWCPSGCYLPGRPMFTFDPLFHQGAYYVQEASSMFVEQAFRVCRPRPQRVLDLCAAPGGKSTLLASLMEGEGLLVSNEPVAQRAQVLLENVQKWGYANHVVTRALSEDFGRLGAFFDMILVDAPCSGEGMFRKDNPARDQWNPEVVGHCAQRQREILQAVWPALRQGGYLIYSTCTYNVEENERNVAWMAEKLGAEVLPVPAEKEWNVTGNLDGGAFPVCRFLPHRTQGEGFFLALLQKTAEEMPCNAKKKNKNGHWQPLAGEWRRCLKEHIDFVCQESLGEAFALPRDKVEAVGCLSESVRVLSAGIPLYEKRANKLLPRQGLALSTAFRPDAFPQVEISRENALEYLRRLPLMLPDAPRGLVLLTFGGLPLGFVNNLGMRANNLYPQAWRIRSSYAHEAVVSPVRIVREA